MVLNMILIEHGFRFDENFFTELFIVMQISENHFFI